MSIVAYTGLPGSGKSYDVVANQIMPALEAGRKVVTNIPLNLDAIREVTHKGEVVHLPIERIEQEPHLLDEYATAGCLLVLDETWRLWPAGWKAHQIPQTYKSLLAEHRHRVNEAGQSMQIVVCTQDLAQIAAFARQLVEQTFHHTKLSHLGMSGSYRIDVFQGVVTGSQPPIGKRQREILGKYRPEIFKLYKSHTMSQANHQGADEKGMDARGQIWKRPIIWVTAVATVVGVLWGFNALSDIMRRNTGGESASVATRSPASSSSLTGTTFSAQPVQRGTSPTAPLPRRALPKYRLVGTIVNEQDSSRSVAMITDGEHTTVIGLESCRMIDGAIDYSCDYDGFVVDVFGSSHP